MRHDSERVPGKNYRVVAGRPLYAYILETLLRCPEIARVVVDTDSPVITEGVSRMFPEIQLLERPAALRGGEISMNRIIEHDLQRVPSEHYLQTHSTNPLLRPETISEAIRTYRSDGEHDSLFSVTPLHVRLWTAEGKPMNHEPHTLIRTQDLSPVFQENSCLYLFRRDVFLAQHNRLGRNPRMFVIPPEEAWDIDEEMDLAIAETLLRKRNREDGGA